MQGSQSQVAEAEAVSPVCPRHSWPRVVLDGRGPGVCNAYIAQVSSEEDARG